MIACPGARRKIAVRAVAEDVDCRVASMPVMSVIRVIVHGKIGVRHAAWDRGGFAPNRGIEVETEVRRRIGGAGLHMSRMAVLEARRVLVGATRHRDHAEQGGTTPSNEQPRAAHYPSPCSR